MRASTLATFEVVTTWPKTRSPGRTSVSLTATSRIFGFASGGKRGTFLIATGSAVGGALGAGELEPDGLGAAAWALLLGAGAGRCVAAGVATARAGGVARDLRRLGLSGVAAAGERGQRGRDPDGPTGVAHLCLVLPMAR